MFKINKVLNHNALLVIKENQEYLLLDKGIGFGKKVSDRVVPTNQGVLYQLQTETSRGTSKSVVDRIDPMFLEIGNEIIQLAQQLGEMDRNILLPLSDHIAFAIERIKNGLTISNPFSNEIRLLNPKEYEVALKSRQIIQDKTGYNINEDELGYITLHIHSALTNCKVDKGMQVAIIIKESIEKIEENLNTKIDVSSLAYSRLLTHMKYMLMRIETQEKLNLDMDEYVKTNYPLAYEVAQDIMKRISIILHQPIPAIEIGYLALHIQRICDVN